MHSEAFRAFCLKLPHVTEHMPWHETLVFKVGGKMFAIMHLGDGGSRFAFKCSPEDFAELVEQEDIVPAPYLARAHWVSLLDPDALPPAEFKEKIRLAHAHVVARLPKRLQAQLRQVEPFHTVTTQSQTRPK